MAFSRRNFLKLGAASGAATALASQWPAGGDAARDAAGASPEETWVPSVCLQCPAGCGIQAKVIDGRAVKIEGNPAHPINLGRLCPKGHIGLQILYDPDRIKGPLKRAGARGEGKWQPISWDEAVGTVAQRLGELRARGEPQTLVVMGGRYRGQMHALFGRFMQAYGTPNDVGHSSICADGSPIAHYLTQGIKSYLGYDWDNTNYILCFGGSFLEAWRPTTRLLRAYGHMRRERPVRGKLVQVDTRFSVTAAKADEWLAIRPGTDGALALGIAHVIVKEELHDREFVEARTLGFEDWVDDKTRVPHMGFKRLVLSEYSPDRVAAITGIPAETIVRVAREFATTRPAIAAGERGSSMQSNGVYNRMAIHALNALVGSIDRPGGVTVQRGPHFTDWPKLEPDPIAQAGLAMPRVDYAGTARFPLAGKVYQHMPEIFAGQGPYPVKALMLYYTNPLFSSPEVGRFYKAIERVPFIADFTPFMSETAEYADLILPDHTYLERWQDDVIYPSLGYPVVGLRQPVVKPLYDTMNTGDVLLRIAHRMGGSLAAAFPWKTMEEVLRFRFRKVWEEGGGNITAATFDEFWSKLRREGVWFKKGYAFGEWDRVLKTPSGKFEFYSLGLKKKLDELAAKAVEKAKEAGKESTPDVELEAIVRGLRLSGRGDHLYLPHYEPIRHAGDPKRYPLLLNTYKLMTHAEGRGANAPWVLERLGVHVKQRWDSWAELNPATARELGIDDGDPIWIESSVGKLRTRAKLYAGAQPGVVSMPFTLGHRAYGRYARTRGANPNWILANEYDYLGGTAAFFSTRVRVTRI